MDRRYQWDRRGFCGPELPDVLRTTLVIRSDDCQRRREMVAWLFAQRRH